MNTQTAAEHITASEPRDEKLWKAAKRRVEFKKHLLIYLLINAFLWCLWYFNGADTHSFLPWPAFVTIGWGTGLFFNFLSAYSGIKDSMLENEYQKLRSKQA